MSDLQRFSRARIAVTTAFIINGFTVGAFYARVPDFKKQLGVSNSALGLALLCIAIGVLIGLGFSGKQSAKFGSAPITHYATYALGISLLIVGPVINFPTLCLSFVVFGFCLSTQDVAMNSHAIVLEQEAKRRYMSTFHAMFSLGALGGGAVGGLFAQQNKTIMWQCAFITMLIFLANFFVRNWFLSADLDKHAADNKKKIKRPFLFLIVGLLGTCAAIGEGSAGDWGAILSRDTFDASPFVSTLPFICFSAAMVIGRLFGDRLASKYGPMKLIVGGGLIAGVGLGGGLIVGGVGGVIFGWFLFGAALSAVIPLLFSAAGSMANKRFAGSISPAEAVAMISGISYFGFIVGPPLMGFLADAITLRWAMLVPAILAIIISASSRIFTHE